MEPRRPKWPLVAAGIAATALLGWGIFHPDFRPDPRLVSASVHKELAKTGFKATQGVASAAFETTETVEGQPDHWTARQKIVGIDAVLTEKRTRRETKGTTQQASGLYAGPLTVVRFRRVWPPLIGELLPYQFWTLSRMTEFAVDEARDFPHAPGGRLLARATYEDRYENGELAVTDRWRLRCDVTLVVAAASVDARLTGRASRLECTEVPDPGGRQIAKPDTQPYVLEDVRYSHWYILDRGWSIPIEGVYTGRVGDVSGAARWRSKLISFE